MGGRQLSGWRGLGQGRVGPCGGLVDTVNGSEGLSESTTVLTEITRCPNVFTHFEEI